jgi:hypothetical protein
LDKWSNVQVTVRNKTKARTFHWGPNLVWATRKGFPEEVRLEVGREKGVG